MFRIDKCRSEGHHTLLVIDFRVTKKGKPCMHAQRVHQQLVVSQQECALHVATSATRDIRCMSFTQKETSDVTVGIASLDP